MQKQSKCSSAIIKPHFKRGIGIIEVMVAALVLGILYAAVSNLQKGNREALLRIRGRDGATEVAQNVIDSLGALGLASFTDDNLIACSDGEANCFTLAKTDDEGNKVANIIKKTRSWMGQPGLKENTMTVTYTVDVKFTSDNEFNTENSTFSYKAQSGSFLLLQDPAKKCGEDGTSCATHVFAKRVLVTVSWPYKGSTQSISVSGVIR